MQTEYTPLSHNTSRLRSLDVFRGLTIALMILVNSPGFNTTYAFLEHSAWNGCTLADLVFPFFVFIVGVSSVFSLSTARERGTAARTLQRKVLKRAFWIFAIGLFLNAFPFHFHLETIRLFGVLQRIAICYAVASFFFLYTSARTEVFTILALLIGYWLMIIILSPSPYNAENNITAIIDRYFLAAPHLYGKTFDPEGLLSTLPAIASVLIGNLTGRGLRSSKNTQQKLIGLGTAGLFALAAGGIWSVVFPLNKTLWSSSYVLWTAGLALLILAVCYGLIELKGSTRWSRFFEIFGRNAIAAYVLHVFFLKVQAMIMLTLPNGSYVNLRLYLTQTLFGWASTNNQASLFYAISYTLLWFIVLMILDRKKIYLKL